MMIGDQTLFMRVDVVEQAWPIVQPVLDAWTTEKAGQVGDAHEAELAGEGQRLIAALLLGKAGEVVLAGVIDLDRPPCWIARRREPGKRRIADRSGRLWGRTAQFRGPPQRQPDPPRTTDFSPPLGFAIEKAGPRAAGSAAVQEASKFVAERIDAMLQALIEHVANHDHAALRPLAHPAEIWMIELRVAPISVRERAE